MTFVKIYDRYLEYPYETLLLFDRAGLFKSKCFTYSCFGYLIYDFKIWPYFFIADRIQEELLEYLERVWG